MTRRKRLERKLERRKEWSEKADARSAARFDAAGKIADGIPFGQPILVGHHSERHARRDQDRIHSNMSRGVEEHKLAEDHRSKAGGIECQLDRSVFSDDADAVDALERRIAEHEAERKRMKLINLLYRRSDAVGLAAMGLDFENLRSRVNSVGLSWVKVPYEGYQLTNLGARIRADKKRIEEIGRRKALAEEATASGGVLVKVAGEYCSVTFAEKPPHETLDALRAAGFYWGGGSWSGQVAKLSEVLKTEQ